MRIQKMVKILIVSGAVPLFIFGMHWLRTPYMHTRVELEVKTGTADQYQVFYDAGNGFSEKKVISMNISSADDFQTVSFSLPPVPLKRIRIDPGYRSENMEIRSISLITPRKTILWTPAEIMKEFQFNIKVVHLYSPDVGNRLGLDINQDDPQIVYSGNIGQIVKLTDEAVRNINMMASALFATLIFIVVLFWDRLKKIWLQAGRTIQQVLIRRGPKTVEKHHSHPLLVILIVAAFVFYLICSLTMGSPIFGSDEYAFYIFGKFLGKHADLLALDPGLQNISNVAYFYMLHFWTALGLEDFTQAWRIIHILEYCLTAYILYRVFIETCEPRNLLLGSAGYLLLPSACYILAVMPEIEIMLLGAMLGYVTVVIFPVRQNRAAVLAGFLIGLALLIKPHAIAMLVSVLFAMISAVCLGLVPKKDKYDAGRVTAVMLASAYIAMIILWRVCNKEWTINPSDFMGLKYYGNYLTVHSAAKSVVGKILNTIMYSGAHTAVLLLLFCPAIVGILMSWARILNIGVKSVDFLKNNTQRINMIVLFVSFMLISHILMAAYFTAGAAAGSEFEAMRVHGRYLGPVIIFLPFLYFIFIKPDDQKYMRLVAIMLLIAVLLNQFLVFKYFKIYPWDYPALFGFYRFPNHYQWNMEARFPAMGRWLMLAVFGSALLMLGYKKAVKPALYFLLFIILSAGVFQTLQWMNVHTQTNQYLTKPARLISQLLRNNSVGRGVFVSDERYGSMSYVLYGLGNAPKVLARKKHSIVTASEVAGADWVLFGKDYIPEFAFSKVVKIGSLRFYSLKPGITVVEEE